MKPTLCTVSRAWVPELAERATGSYSDKDKQQRFFGVDADKFSYLFLPVVCLCLSTTRPPVANSDK